MTDYNATRARSSTQTTARPLALPVPRSQCTRFMTTERLCFIKNVLPSSSSWDLLHHVFSPLARSFLCLYVTDLLICKAVTHRIWTRIHGNYVMFTALGVRLRLRIYGMKRHKNVSQSQCFDWLLTLVVIHQNLNQWKSFKERRCIKNLQIHHLTVHLRHNQQRLATCLRAVEQQL